MKLRAFLKTWARRITIDAFALWIAARDPRVPWYAKAAAGGAAAYTLSPISLVPDSVGLLGDLSDLIVVPLGIIATVRLIPDALMREFRKEAIRRERRPRSYKRVALVVLVWAAVAAGVAWFRGPAG